MTLEELRKVQTDVTQEELDRAKAQVQASLLMSLESTGSRTRAAGPADPGDGRVIPVEETKAKIDAVDHRGRAGSRGRAAFRAPPTLAALGPAGQGAGAGRDRRAGWRHERTRKPC